MPLDGGGGGLTLNGKSLFVSPFGGGAFLIRNIIKKKVSMKFSSCQSLLHSSLVFGSLFFRDIFESLALVCLDLIYVFTMFDEGR